jgi:ATP-dependent protease ClpP protease subunit
MQRNNRLLSLIRDNLAAPRDVRVVNQDDEATIYLYDVIDSWFGISAATFVKTINEIKAPRIHLRINSPGGDVFEARAMATAIREHRSEIIAHVDGMAISAATWVTIAAKEVEMSEGAFFMIHQSWAFAMGNAEDMAKMADLLTKIDDAIAADYVKKTRKEKAQVDEWMRAETWFTAAEAKEAGFVDRVAASGANAGNTWNLGAYKNAPKALTERPAPPATQTYDREALERKLGLFERIAA